MVKKVLNRTSVALMTGAFLVVGCNEVEDLYNPSLLQDDAKEVFPVERIDANHTWTMNTVCRADVKIWDAEKAQGMVKIYSANPYGVTSNAKLLGKHVVNGGENRFSFDIPAALSSVYVMRETAAGSSVVKPAVVSDGVVQVAFGAPQTRSAVAEEMGFRVGVEFNIPAEEDFRTEAPAGCVGLEKYYEQTSAVPYLLTDVEDAVINMYLGGDLYIGGRVSVSEWAIAGAGNYTRIYLLPGAVLTVKDGEMLSGTGSKIVVGEGASIVMSEGETMQLNSGTLLNRGTLDVESLVLVGDTYLYNEGEITCGDDLFLTNAGTALYNAEGATMNVEGTLSIGGDADFYNGGDFSVKTTVLNCTNGSWQNDGHYSTGNMQISAWNKNIRNGCQLVIDGMLDIATAGMFVENYVCCETLKLVNADVQMAEASFFEVKGQATMYYNPIGFTARQDGKYAVLKMGSAVLDEESGALSVAYRGNLYVDCPDHYGNALSGMYEYIVMEGNACFSDNAEGYSIPVSACTPGYNPTPGEVKDEPMVYTYAFEDMLREVGDYDYNDVVFSVTAPVGGKVTVSLLAAGAQKALAVKFAGESLFGEIHAALGVSSGTLVNTGFDGGVDVEPILVELEVGEDFLLAEHGDFYISGFDGEVHIPSFTPGFTPGDIPYAVCVPGEWAWPVEKVSVEEAYSGFAEWAKDATRAVEWYKDSTAENVVR